MATIHKRGFIPDPPLTRPPLTVIEYKPCEEPQVWASERHGSMEVIAFKRSADRNRSRALVKFFERKLLALDFSEDAVERLSTGLAEAIPNAMTYAISGSRVGVVLIITGQHPHRHLMLLISNFIAPGTPPPPANSQVKSLDELLTEFHGRGTGMLKLMSSGMAVARSEDYDHLTVVDFTEQLPTC